MKPNTLCFLSTTQVQCYVIKSLSIEDKIVKENLEKILQLSGSFIGNIVLFLLFNYEYKLQSTQNIIYFDY